MEDFLAMVLPRPADTVGHSGQLPPNILCPAKFCCAQKNLFQTHDKNQNLSPIKMYFPLITLKPGYGPGSAKIVSAIRIFCFEVHSASKCSITKIL